MKTTKDGINQVLKIIGKNGFDGLSIKSHNAVLAVGYLLQKDDQIGFNSQRIVSEVRRQKLIDIAQKNDKVSFRLTPAGAYRLQKITIDELTIRVPKKWDKKWRMITFDIPVTQSKSRTYFTNHLRSLGLKMVQRSSWAHPYDCFEEVTQVAGYYNITRYCSFFIVTSLDQNTQKKLKTVFKLN